MDANDDRTSWKRTLAALGIMAGSFAFQETGVLPLLPTIQRQLPGAGTVSSALLESGFLIVAAIAAPMIDKFGDRHGKKRMLLITLAIYFIGALGAGLAPNFITLVVFRSAQGVGGALFALSFAVMRDEASEHLNVAIGWLVGAFGIGACLGLGLSGVIAQALSWRYIFFGETVLIVIAAALVAMLVPRSSEKRDLRMDYGGLALLAAALASLIIALMMMLKIGWPVVGLFVLAFAFFGGWIFRELHTDQPLLKVSMLTRREVLLPNLGSGLAGYVAFSTFFLVPRFVQVPLHLPAGVATQLHYGFGAGPVALGLFLLPVGVGILCAGPSGGVLGRKYGGKWPFVAGLALLTIGAALLAFLHGDRVAFVAWLFLVGAGFGLSIGAAGVFITQSVDASETGIATAFNSLVRLISGGIGAQVAAAILKSQSLAGSTAPHESAFELAFGIGAILALIGTGLALLVPAGDHPATKR